MAAVELVDPATHAYPAVHAPLHAGAVSAGTAPNDPAGQITHTAAPAKLYRPAGQMAAVELVDPAMHAYPAVQSPLHAAAVSPVVAPKDPAAQGPEQVAIPKATADPNLPAGHAMHDPDPARLYCPAGHTAAVAVVEPATHAYPAVQDPVHAAVVRPVVDPNRPGVHGVQRPDPATAYCPAMHMRAVGDVEPAIHAYPAVQFPVHVGTDSPVVDP